MKRALRVLLLLLTATGTVRAANVVWPVASLTYGESYGLWTETTFGAGAGIAMDLVYSGGPTATLEAQNFTVGAGHVWFQTGLGTPVDAAAVTSADPFVNAYTAELGSLTMNLNEIFYIAFYVEGEPYFNAAETYGWASLVWTGGTDLTLIDSAYETTGAGIYAGTYDAIPEPASAGLVLAGLSALALRRKRRGRQGRLREPPYFMIKPAASGARTNVTGNSGRDGSPNRPRTPRGGVPLSYGRD